MKLPIDIINKILIYINELNNDILILQYDNNHNIHYKINFESDLLWNIKSIITMKRIYPLGNHNITSYNNRNLYKDGKAHYENLLRKKII